AMGSTRDNTLRIVDAIRRRLGLEAVAHLACIGHSKREIETVLQQVLDKGIRNIVALRGDAPQEQAVVGQKLPDAFKYASDLVAFIRSDGRFAKSFSLAVGGYPEGHVECRDLRKDLEHLKIKVDAGADAVITQLFFDNHAYFDFVSRARSAGIRVPIVPGIMPVTHGPQIKRFATMCGASIPDEILRAIERYGDDQSSVEEFGIDYATRQCRELLKLDTPGLHFYTLNKSHATREIYRNLHLDQCDSSPL
ncbi:MAG: methylenetetrahydrofolate reductase, partial [Candidatus Omnitrophota bacterium]